MCFIESIFAWNIPLVSLIFLKRSLVFPILLFSSISFHWWLRKAFLSVLAILWNLAFKWIYVSFSPLLLFLFVSQLFVRPPQTTILPFFISFPWGWSDGLRGREELPLAQGQEWLPRGALARSRSGAAAERTNPISKERRLCGRRRADRSYSPFKVRRGGREETPSSKVRSKAERCWSSREEIPHVQDKRNPSKTVGVGRGHQRADTLKP